MHSGNGEHDEMDRRAIACFDQALIDVGMEGAVRQVLHDYFAWVTTTTMSRYHRTAEDVPDGLNIPTLVMGRTPAVSLHGCKGPLKISYHIRYALARAAVRQK